MMPPNLVFNQKVIYNFYVELEGQKMKLKPSAIILLQLSNLPLLTPSPNCNSVCVTKYNGLSFSFHYLLIYLLAFCVCSAFSVPASVIFLLVTTNVDSSVDRVQAADQLQKRTSNFSFYTELTSVALSLSHGNLRGNVILLGSILGPFL